MRNRPDSRRRKKRQAPFSTVAPNATITPPSTVSSAGGVGLNMSVIPSSPTLAPNVSTTPGTIVEERVIGVQETFHLTDLEHFTEYLIQVSACNMVGCSQAAAVYGRTLPKGTKIRIL